MSDLPLQPAATFRFCFWLVSRPPTLPSRKPHSASTFPSSSNMLSPTSWAVLYCEHDLVLLLRLPGCFSSDTPGLMRHPGLGVKTPTSTTAVAGVNLCDCFGLRFRERQIFEVRHPPCAAMVSPRGSTVRQWLGGMRIVSRRKVSEMTKSPQVCCTVSMTIEAMRRTR
ncbi:hypothetical protein BD289DRAFT_240482 [Coniella lustricola]|uniref:Uncharacterized protein n=1 Tax=Coniella lustricola TaxID=2025994 RepID=A0A2T3ALD1_9PEZI|nr:hypothetical protein BD289DRAFT_240482 [Coniella lustricola]